MRYALSAQVHATHVRDDLVILDAAGDAYYCIAGAAPWLSLSADRREITGGPQQVEDLLKAGLLRCEPAVAAPPAAEPPSDENLRRAWRRFGRPTPGAACLSFRTGFRASRDIRKLAFSDLIERACAEPVVGGPRSLAASCGTFEALRPWAPFDGDCLFRSYWQLLFLKALGHSDVRWVFGVRTWPFFAHCWLQAGDQVLNDDPDILTGYRQIMAV